MALNKAVFKTRALTALIFVAVMLVGLLWNFYAFLLLFSIIHIGCWFEYLKITELINGTTIDKGIKNFIIFCGFTLFFVLGLQHYGFNFYATIAGFVINLKYPLWIFLFICLGIFLVQNKQINNGAKKMIFLGFIYISASFTAFLFLKDYYEYTYLGTLAKNSNILGVVVPCAIIFAIWINDTMAYVVGSFIGKTPFSKISPKKTWEGTIGGALLCVLVTGLLGYFLPVTQNLSVKHWIAIGLICAVFGTLGDLLESKIKRTANIKDSGSFMPGHGGFLDRFDSLLIAAPAVWIYFKVFVL